MRLLELFSGTGSVGDVFTERGWQVVSVDIAPAPGAVCDIEADILTLSPREIEEEYGRFDCIWASPPCTQYSRARTTAKTPRNLTLADSLVQKAIDFIEELQSRGVVHREPILGAAPDQGGCAGVASAGACGLLQVRAEVPQAHGHMDELPLGR
jgi:hypothetical protein